MYGEEEQDVATAEFEGAGVVTLRGEWDVAARERLREVLQGVGTKSDVIVDLREATFFDSTALAELIALYKRLSMAGRRLEALVGGSNMRRLLELTSLDGLLGASPERARYLNERLPAPDWPDVLS
jgi:anti-anti-sigma factor